MRQYLQDPDHAYRYVKTSMFQHHLERVSGQDLDPFFQTWFYGRGYPIYDLVWKQDWSDRTLRIEFQQSQSHASVAFFDQNIPLRLKGNASDTSVIVPVRKDQNSFSIPLDFEVDSVLFDPEKWLIAKLESQLQVYDFEPGERLKIYPNPAQSYLQVQVNRQELEVRNILITDLQGQVLLETAQPILSDLNVTRLDVRHLPEGAYYIYLETREGKTGAPFQKID
jgi:hypothetical protein